MMDKDLIERLAREAGLAALVDPNNTTFCNGRLLAGFAAMIAEECAKMCDSMDNGRWEHSPPPEVCAAAIRERFK